MDEGPSILKLWKCKLGAHQWEEKEFIFPLHYRVCSVCGKEQTRKVIDNKWKTIITLKGNVKDKEN